ncbi:MAG: hypothetical protein AABY22_31225 [Nanoarchaeota archaeon]
MKIGIPKGRYIKKIDINDNDLEISFSKRKKIALLFISINDKYWPYLTQAIKDCKKNFLPQHNIDYFIWTDFNKESKDKIFAGLDALLKTCLEASSEKKQETLNVFLNMFAQIIRLYEHFYLALIQDALKNLLKFSIAFKHEGSKFWIESPKPLVDADIILIYEIAKQILSYSYSDMETALNGATLIETEPIEWPHPTLMRYHLFLQQEEKLKDYDYIFYLDADMRVVSKISDEIMGEGLTAAQHPMYALRKEYIPPYEPNPNSAAYIKRPGRTVDENGKQRFLPYYYAGGFQGGITRDYLKAANAIKKNIDKDFNNNYIAIWNDESHWNKYLSDYKGDLIVLSPSYVYPDSLIKEYYVPVWGKEYEPKIITLTKPFSTSLEGAEEVNKFIAEQKR